MDLLWVEVRSYLERRLNQVCRGLEDSDGPQMHRLQGRATALRELLRLPEILREERELDRLEKVAREGK